MADPLSSTFAALADPTRRAILARLSRGEATVTELAAPHDMSLAAVSRHVKVLVAAGLVVQGRDAQRRPCRLRTAPLHDVTDWVTFHRNAFEESFDRLADHLASLAPPPPPQEEM